MSKRHAPTDAQSERIKDLLPGKPGGSGRIVADNRLFVGEVLFVTKTGIPRRDLPERFGRWNSSGGGLIAGARRVRWRKHSASTT